ncbi:hypothetical protein BRADI_4g23836v3 [Brachypodium distachyon]|uniref:BTB domain-containing protein n=1 Tax=Brachypodium distachyon TaxID=15368 RepID=A0A0Q3ESA1_BRADI|nr:hypothetical protein BRADI_4g23836v3 [Brachypodium distachyon]
MRRRPEKNELRTHVIKIDGYSQIKELLQTGEYTTSIPFSVGGHSWAMRYYPNGCRERAGYLSVFLVLDSADAKDVKAKVSFGLLDMDGVTSPTYSGTFEYIFQNKGSSYGFTKLIKHKDLEGSVHLRGDSVRIRCDVTIVTKIRSEETKGIQYVKVPPSKLHQNLGGLLESMDGADVTFQVGGQKFPAHRYVLAARSSVFNAELFGAMKEKIGGSMKIDDMESDVFESLLHFIYTDSLPVVETVMAGHLLVAADRLKLMCEEKLCNHIDAKMVATTLALAEQHSCHGLKEACFDFLSSPSNLKAMKASDGYEHLKNSCPSVLKELIARLLPVELKAVKDIIMSI